MTSACRQCAELLKRLARKPAVTLSVWWACSDVQGFRTRHHTLNATAGPLAGGSNDVCGLTRLPVRLTQCNSSPCGEPLAAQPINQ
jgi:hypothetical protein